MTFAYKSAKPLSIWVNALLLISFVLFILNILIILLEMNIVSEAMGGKYAEETDLWIFPIQIALQTACYVALVIGFLSYLVWKYKAYKNLNSFIFPPVRYRPGWAVATYFIPIAWYFLPYKIMKELWINSDPRFENLDEKEVMRILNKPSNLLRVWWASFLLFSFIGFAVPELTPDPELGELLNYYKVNVADQSATILMIVFTIVVIRKVSNRQEGRFEALYLRAQEQYRAEESQYSDTFDSSANEIDEDEVNYDYLPDHDREIIYGRVLGLKGQVSKSEITKRYHELMDKYHPDKVSHLGEEFQCMAEKKAKLINCAYAYFRQKYGL